MKALLFVVAIAAVGMGMVLTGPWRQGIVVMGAALTVAAVLRAALPPDKLGELSARSRPIDVLVLTSLGFALIALANTIPAGR